MRARRHLMSSIAAVAAFLLLATACTSGSSDKDGKDTSSSTSLALKASARGVTADTITLAYTYLDFDALKQQNLVKAGWGDQQATMQSLVDALNADGGINGRKVKVDYAPYSPVGTEAAEAACLRLTKDTEVFAVLGGFLGPAEPANTCIVGGGDTILVGGVQSPERLAQAKAPWITDRAQRSRKADILLSLLDSTDRISGAKVAVVTNTDAADIRSNVQKSLKTFHVDVVEDLVLDAPIGDIPAEDTAWGPLTERIRASGANTVLIVGNPSSAIRNLASQGLDVQLWATDEDTLNNLGATVNPADAQGTLTATPPTPDGYWKGKDATWCRDAFEKAHPDVTIKSPKELGENDEDWDSGLRNSCSFLTLFQAVATKAGADLTNVSFSDAARGMGEFSFGGFPYASLGKKTDANDSFQLAEFQADVGAEGGLAPITKIIDVTKK